MNITVDMTEASYYVKSSLGLQVMIVFIIDLSVHYFLDGLINHCVYIMSEIQVKIIFPHFIPLAVQKLDVLNSYMT